MVEWLEQVAPNAPYLVIFGILLATGFGLPMPEDIPLALGGALCGDALANGHTHPTIWIMLPGCMVAIVGSDVILYYLGRWFGPTIHRHPILKRIVGSRNLARTKILFKRHDAKFVFFARFLPGVRAPAFFTAGTFKMPLRKFLRYDGSAALLSAPWAMILGYYFHDEVHYALRLLGEGKTKGFVIIGVLIAIFIAFHWIVNKKIAKATSGAEAAKKTSSDKPAE